MRAVGRQPPPERMALGLQARRTETPLQCKSACRAGATGERADSAVVASRGHAGPAASGAEAYGADRHPHPTARREDAGPQARSTGARLEAAGHGARPPVVHGRGART